MPSVDTITQWREDWSSASVLKHTIVTDPTVQQPGYHLPRHTWSLMNRSGPVKAMSARLRSGPITARRRVSTVARYLTGPSGYWRKVPLTISLRTGHVKVRYSIRYSFSSLNLLNDTTFSNNQ